MSADVHNQFEVLGVLECHSDCRLATKWNNLKDKRNMEVSISREVCDYHSDHTHVIADQLGALLYLRWLARAGQVAVAPFLPVRRQLHRCIASAAVTSLITCWIRGRLASL